MCERQKKSGRVKRGRKRRKKNEKGEREVRNIKEKQKFNFGLGKHMKDGSGT